MLNTASIETVCMGCFTQHPAPVMTCPKCGYNEAAQDASPHLLRPRTILNGKYLVGKVLGQGGFGITYIGWDLNLDIKVAIKEYYPSGYVTRETTSTSAATVQPFTGSQGEYFLQGREKFINEAKTLAKFFSLPGIVSVKDYFIENGTAYISMEYIDGQTLKDYLAKMNGRLPAAQVFDMMNPVMSSLAEVHKAGLIHRDISPDNIMISKEGYMKLLDFGAARDFTESGNKSMSIMLKPGFAPEEQYRSKGVQGPWTDVYALSATIYKCITGVTPEESVERVRRDEVKPPSMLGVPISPAQEAALMTGMAVSQNKRHQNVPALYSALYGTAAPVQPTGAVSPMSPDYVYPVTQPAFTAASAQTQETGFKAWVKKHKLLTFGCFTPIALVLALVLVIIIVAVYEVINESPDTPEPPVSTSTPAVENYLLGSWSAVQEGGLMLEYAFNGNGEYYSMLYDPEDIDELELTYIRVLEGTYEIAGSDVFVTPLWSVTFDYDVYDVVPYDGDDTWKSSFSVRGNALTMVDPSGTTSALTKTTPSVWEFGHREKMANGQPVYIRKVTLGQFSINQVANPTRHKGWATSGVIIENLDSTFTARDFTRRYLVLELGAEPAGDFLFAWVEKGAPAGSWTQTDNLKAQGTTLVIDMTQINGYDQYIQLTDMLIYVCYFDDSWDDLPLLDAYFAESPRPLG